MELARGVGLALTGLGLALAAGIFWSRSRSPDTFFDGSGTAQVVSTHCANHQLVVFAYAYEGRLFANAGPSPTPCEELKVNQQVAIRFSRQNPARSELVGLGMSGARHAE